MSLGEKLQLGARESCTTSQHRQMGWAVVLAFAFLVVLSAVAAQVGVLWVWVLMTIIDTVPLAFMSYVVAYHARSHRELRERGDRS